MVGKNSINKQILELFHELEPDLRDVVSSVLAIERQNISYQRPRVKDDIKNILERVAKDNLTKKDNSYED